MFGILSSSVFRDGGQIHVKGVSFDSNDMKELYKSTGFTAQTNILWDSLTVKQHLSLICDLKGYDEREKEYAIGFLMRLLEIQEYKDRKAENLSGGNKRKLCVCLAILSNPKLLFLDEPSTGVDAMARKALWNTIKVSNSANSTTLSSFLT